MIRHNLEQGSPEWYQARLGKPTASQFKKILTPKKGERSKQDTKYLFLVVAEKLLQQPLIQFPTTEYMEDGKKKEPHAALAFEIERERILDPLGFITDDKERWGASPDRIFADDPTEIAEFKVPVFVNYLRCLLSPKMYFVDLHRPQLQGQLFVGEFEKVWLIGYNEKQPLISLEVNRDDIFIKNLEAALKEFCAQRDELVAEAKRRGVLALPQAIATPVEQHYGEQLERDGLDVVIQGD